MAADVLLAAHLQQPVGWGAAAQSALDAAQILLPDFVHMGIFHHVAVGRQNGSA
jgi:hypothetical protein